MAQECRSGWSQGGDREKEDLGKPFFIFTLHFVYHLTVSRINYDMVIIMVGIWLQIRTSSGLLFSSSASFFLLYRCTKDSPAG